MKSIKIEISEQGVVAGVLADIQTALGDVNGKATSFTITSSSAVVSVAKRAEKYLSDYGVPASDRGGATVTYRPEGPSANSYKYGAASTQIKMRRKSGSSPIWYLDEVSRVDVYPKNGEKFCVTISDSSARNLVKRTLAAFDRHQMPADAPTAQAA